MNVVYRGVHNPISVSVRDAKSYEVSGLGLKSMGGKYYVVPGQGLETKIVVKIIKNDNSEIIEDHIFRIKTLDHVSGKINGRNCSDCIVKMTKAQLRDAEISITVDNFLMDIQVAGFTVKFPNNRSFRINNDYRFTTEVLNEILKLKTGSLFDISDIHQNIENLGLGCTLLPRITPIKVMVVDEETPYYQSKQFIKDSLRNIKTEKKFKKL
jgi:hypothetical protein